MKKVSEKKSEKQEFEFFQEYYEGKKILVQDSREELDEDEFKILTYEIQKLTRKGFQVVLAEDINQENLKDYGKLIFVDSEGSLLDDERKRVPAMTAEKLAEIMEEKNSHIQIKTEVKDKLKKIIALTAETNEAVLTAPNGVYQEITTLLGSGTLVYDSKKVKIQPLKKEHARIFDLAYNKYLKLDKWQERNPEEQTELKKNHYVFDTSKSILGGFSLLEKALHTNPKIDALSFECWWSQIPQNGIGKKLLQEALKIAKAKNKPLFLYTHWELEKYPELGIQKHENIRSKSDAILWTT